MKEIEFSTLAAICGILYLLDWTGVDWICKRGFVKRGKCLPFYFRVGISEWRTQNNTLTPATEIYPVPLSSGSFTLWYTTSCNQTTSIPLVFLGIVRRAVHAKLASSKKTRRAEGRVSSREEIFARVRVVGSLYYL